jgi:Ca2+-binding RTX toxin-like protein
VTARVPRIGLLAALAGAVACALAPAVQAAPPTVACVVTSATTSTLAIALGTDAVTIDATGDPVAVDGTNRPCANLTLIRITGGAEANTVTSLLTGRAVTITADLGGGNDRLSATGSRWIGPIAGGEGNDVLSAPAANGSLLQGDGGDDELTGAGGADDLQGGAGNDVLRPGRGGGTNDGGGGDDTVTYDGVGVNVTADLSPGGGATTDAAGVTLDQSISDVDNLVGGTGTDTFTGNGDANVLDGGLGSAVDTLSGGGGPDHLLGGGGSDTLSGEAGADVLDGGAGEDALVGGADADVLNGGADADTASYADRTTSGPGVNVSLEGPAGSVDGEGDAFTSIERLRGGAGDDTLTGGTAVDTIDGAGGNDTIFGGAGNDTLIGGPGDRDRLSYQGDASTIRADLRSPVLLPATSDTTSGFEDVVGGNAGDTLVGNDVANHLDGNGGADTLSGLGGSDVINGGDGDDTIRPGIGTGQNDGGNDVNLLSYDDAGVGVTVSLGVWNALTAGTALVGPDTQSVLHFTNVTGSPQDDRLEGDTIVGVANVLTGLGGDDTLLGGPGNDTLDGGASDDTLLGGAGDDTLTGGADDLASGGSGDTASYEGSTAAINANLSRVAAPQATGDGNDTIATVENLTGGTGADTLEGTTGPNTLDGRAGNDTIIGGGDSGDTLIGGEDPGDADIDTLSYAAATGDVVANLSGDPSLSPAPTDTATGFENVFGGAGNDTLVGDNGANTLIGNNGNDTLVGLRGDDNLLGGIGDDTLRPGLGGGTDTGDAGTDTVTYEDVATAVTASIASPFGSASGTGLNQQLQTVENITGGTAGDDITGSAAANTLAGGASADTLSGLGGADDLQGQQDDDTLIGGIGNDGLDGGPGADRASYEDRTSGAVVASLQAGTGGIAPESDTFTAIENLRGGAGNDTLTGDSTANVIQGGAGSDTIVGVRGPGQDTLTGGESPGDDDTVSYETESSPVRIDLGATAPDPALTDIATEFESAIGGGGDDTITGDDDANRIVGGSGIDTLSGKGGADTITGGDDEDTIAGGNDADQLSGDDNNDIIDGGDGNDAIDGGDDADTLTGGAGADVLAGGRGTDTVSYALATDAVSVSLDGRANDGLTPAAGPSEGDNVLSAENITGGPKNDVLTGDQAINTLLGGEGDDVLDGGGNDDVLDGQGGNDTASYAGRGADEPVVATLDGVAHGGAANEFDTFLQIEAVRGGSGPDALSGGPGNDVLAGGPGGDTLAGGDGADSLYGEDGDDALAGGAGPDALDGGTGADRLDGGLGADAFSGGDGDDDIFAFDGTVENIRCGAGTDRAAHDLGDTFDLGDCELRRVPSDSELPFFPGSVAPRDRDSDGVNETADCNDTNPAVRPGAPEVPGNGIDENCDGADASAPALGTTLRSRFARTKRGMRVRVLELLQVPAGAQIEVTCRATRSPRCPFSSRRRTNGAARKSLSLRGWFGDRPLSIGTVIEVRVTASGAVGRSASLTMVRRGSPKRVLGCLPPGAKKAVSC